MRSLSCYRRPFTFLSVLLLIALALPLTVGANYANQPDPIPGWTHDPRLPDDTPQQHGIFLAGNQVTRSSPKIADIDGNPDNGQEVAVASNDGTLYVYGANGTQLWATNVLPAPCGAALGNTAKINTAVTVARIFGNSQPPHVLVPYGLPTGPDDCDGGIAVYNGTNGQLVWRFSTRQYLNSIGIREDLYGVTTTPAVADTDGDGTMEIAFGSLDRHIYLLNADGSVRWLYHTADTAQSSPVFYNINDTPALELIAGADISGNDELQTPNGGFLYAFDTASLNGRYVEFDSPKFGIANDSPVIWRHTFTDQAIFSSPAIGNVLPSNPGPEIVIGSGCFFPAGSSDKLGKWVKLFDLAGNELQTLNADDCTQSSPALGDLDDDGVLEVVIVTRGDPPDTGNDFSRVQAWNGEDPTPIWTTTPTDPNSGNNDPSGGDRQSPVIADIDGNGSLEVLVSNFWSVHVLQGNNGTPLTCQNPQCGGQPSLFAWGTLKATPAVGDVNNDGMLDVVIGGENAPYLPGRGVLYGWTNLDAVIDSPPGNQPAYSVPWGQFRRNGESNATIDVLRAVPNSLGALIALVGPGTSQQLRVQLSSDWTVVSVNDPLELVQLNSRSGTATQPLVVTVQTYGGIYGGITPGTKTATIVVGSASNPNDTDSQITIPITITVVNEVQQVFVPAVLR